MKTRLFLTAVSAAVVGALAGAGVATTAAIASTPTTRTGPAVTTAGTDIDFAGTVALSNCSGSLVRYTSSQPSDPAMVMTAGHCYEEGFLQPGEVLVDVPSKRSMELLDAEGDEVGKLRASSVVYGTMTDTDVLLYELNQTYAEIQQRTGLSALTLAVNRPPPGEDISVVSGFWVRIFTCAVDGYVFRVHEAVWTWEESLRYRQPGCEVIGGTSGSPVIRHDTGQVVGVNNTINEDGEECTLNNPCEEARNGDITFEQGRGYAQQSRWFYTCLSDSRELNLDLMGCLLPDPVT
jgi:V8-like Glu-specific endopeptidase